MNTEINHLRFIYNRMVELHHENENYDYMVRFKNIIDSKESDYKRGFKEACESIPKRIEELCKQDPLI